MSELQKPKLETITVITETRPKDRRRSPRAKISKPLQLRPDDPRLEQTVHATVNASRGGFYFRTSDRRYYVGMRLAAIFPYAALDPCNERHLCEVIRVERLADSSFGVAVRILMR